MLYRCLPTRRSPCPFDLGGKSCHEVAQLEEPLILDLSTTHEDRSVIRSQPQIHPSRDFRLLASTKGGFAVWARRSDRLACCSRPGPTQSCQTCGLKVSS